MGAENLFYVVSPKDIVIARPRDLDDHISWLLERERFNDALAAAEANPAALVDHNLVNIGQSYIKHLITTGNFDEAAALCPRVLKDNSKLWEKWAYYFTEIKQLRVCFSSLSMFFPRWSNLLGRHSRSGLSFRRQTPSCRAHCTR